MEEGLFQTDSTQNRRDDLRAGSPRSAERFVGTLVVLLASLIWAVEPVVAKLALREADFLETSMVRAGFIALIGCLYALLTRRFDRGISRSELAAAGYLALAGTLIGDLLYIYALTRTPVINAVLLGHLQPIFIVLFGATVWKGDALTKHEALGIGIMLLAGVMVTTRSLANLAAFRLGTLGDLHVLIATIAWATTAMVARRYLTGLNAGVITFYRFLIAFAALSFWSLAAGTFRISNTYQIVLGLLVGTGCILYYEGLKRLPAAVVGSLELSTPFFSAVLGFAVLGETVTGLQGGGILLLVLGVCLLSRS